ncbi:MAG TPA: pyridine nucleotide-disulfide oxidoreductase [Myxococcota bacterium]|nr:pyridine nucleotide-disulfide oxidoreductase [Myxococcota bacterium]
MGLACALLLVWGYRLRDELYFTPDEQLGYVLGIVGLGCMVLLLGYSLRKRMRPLASLGPVRSWFQVHMVLGLLGPTAILFHCNFQVGAVNSGVALACVLLVAGSGLVGRFLYPRIHHGLSDRRATFTERRAELEARRGALAQSLAGAPELAAGLRRFETAALAPAAGVARLGQLALLGMRARSLRRSARRALRGQGARERRAALREVRGYTSAVRVLARFRVYERFFALWHAVHLPLCVLLFIAAAVHVVAVNMY